MPPTLNETANSQNSTGAPRSAPVCLEVPVTVRGAVLDDKTNASQSFSERTRTVLVFARGAVLRLTAQVTPGQTVILVNEHTKNEVRCEVQKSKARAAGSGVIELEFSERSDNFWGMTFPGEKPERKPVPAPAPIPAAQPVQDSDAPAWPLDERPLVRTTPVANSGTAEPAPVAAPPKAPPVLAPQPAQDSDAPAWPLDERPLVRTAPAAISNSVPAPSAPSAEPPKAPLALAPQPPVAIPPPSPAPAALAVPAQEPSSMPSWLENSGESIEPASVRFAKNSAPAPIVSQPAYDEPLDFDSPAEPRKAKSSPLPQAAESESTPLPDFLKPASPAGRFVPDIVHPPSATWTGSRILLRASVAALLLLSLSGGGWYLWQRPGRAAWMASLTAPKPADPAVQQAPLRADPAPALSSQHSAPLADSAPLAASTDYNSSAPLPARKSPEEQSQVGFSLPAAAPGSSATQQDSLHSPALSSASVFPKADNSSHLPIPPDAALAALSSSPAESAPVHTAQPSSTLAGSMAPVTSAALPETVKSAAGPTRPARLISSVPPEFPLAARTQHISGDVVVDALIDATGKVASMKIVSGSALLRQAAMDALSKWRYQPALSNGQPVQTQLQLTIQFRLRN